MLRDSASGPEIGLPGQISAGKASISALRPAFGSPITGPKAPLRNVGYMVGLAICHDDRNQINLGPTPGGILTATQTKF